MESIYSFLFQLQMSITWCYAFMLPLFIVYLLLKRQRPAIMNLLSAMNLCLGLLAILNLYALFMMLNDVIHASSSELGGASFSRMLLTMSFAILLLTVIELLFLLKKKWRASWPLSFAALILVNWYLIYNWLSGLLPAGFAAAPWTISYSSTLHEKLLRIFIFIVLVIGCYAFLAFTKKLPFPSAALFSKRSAHV